MKPFFGTKNPRSASIWGLTVGTLLLLATFFMARQQFLLEKNRQITVLNTEADAIENQLNARISYAHSATRALAFVVSAYGVPPDFKNVAQALLQGAPPGSALELLDSGTISHVHPYEANKAALGYNVLADTSRNQEMEEAIEERAFLFAGPFDLKQGGYGVVGRYPIFRNNRFLGIAAVVMQWDAFLQGTPLLDSSTNLYKYQLYKTDRRNGQKTLLIGVQHSFPSDLTVTRSLKEGAWELQLSPLKPVRFFNEWRLLALGALLSVLAGLSLQRLLLEPSRLNALVSERTSALDESQNLYRNTLLRISDGFASIRNDGTILYINELAANHFDRSAADLIGQNAWEVLNALEGTGLKDGIEKALKSGQIQHLNLQKPSDFKWYNINIYPDHEGFSIFATDITHEKESTRLLELTNQVARIGGWEYHQSRRLFNLSPMARELLNLPNHLPFKTDELERYFGAGALEITKGLASLQAGEAEFALDVKVVHGYDRPKWVKIRAQMVIEPDGSRHIYGTIQDIESRIRTQEVIASSARKYRSLFNLNPLPMWIFDRETHLIIDANAAACAHYGYALDELVDTPVAKLWAQHDYERYLERIETGQRDQMQCLHFRQDGSKLLVELFSTPIDEQAEHLELLLARDITERTAHLKAIESQNARLREIAWLQSHRVRAPLARIMAIIQLLRPEHFNPQEDHQLLREIIHSAYELDGMIAEIVKKTEIQQREKN
jgi:PAS domain S-box-containing protein